MSIGISAASFFKVLRVLSSPWWTDMIIDAKVCSETCYISLQQVHHFVYTKHKTANMAALCKQCTFLCHVTILLQADISLCYKCCPIIFLSTVQFNKGHLAACDIQEVQANEQGASIFVSESIKLDTSLQKQLINPVYPAFQEIIRMNYLKYIVCIPQQIYLNVDKENTA